MTSAMHHVRHGLQRRQTWPTRATSITKGGSYVRGVAVVTPSTNPRIVDAAAAFQSDLEEHPEDHFLSPIQSYDYDDWSSESDFDDDDDGEDVDWDAGITDFSLFHDDRQQAVDNKHALPSRWNDMLAQQASALQRSVERSRIASAAPSPRNTRTSNAEDVPGLTPDASPTLRDDLDLDLSMPALSTHHSVPNYLTVVVHPPRHDADADSAIDDMDPDAPLSFHFPRKQAVSLPRPRLERPGLRHSRTLSGKVHVWRRPSRHIYTVGEEAEDVTEGEKRGRR